jgi:hypothetical protein
MTHYRAMSAELMFCNVLLTGEHRNLPKARKVPRPEMQGARSWAGLAGEPC